MNNLTHERLTSLLYYNPLTGTFRWRVARYCVRRGRLAGFGDGCGYQRVCVDSVTYKAHRLAWFYVHGEWPPSGLDVDHIDGDRLNNRIANLRLATRAQNCANQRRPHRDNRLGVKGVSRNRSGWYTGQIARAGLVRYLGTYATLEEASAAVEEAHVALHGEFSPFKKLSR